MKKFNVPQAQLGSISTLCEYLNRDGKMNSCTINPNECVLGNKGNVSKDGNSFSPLEQPSIETTLKNCPKLKLEVKRQ